MGTSSGSYELNHEYASTSDLITRICYRVKTRVHVFYFDSNTTVPL